MSDDGTNPAAEAGQKTLEEVAAEVRLPVLSPKDYTKEQLIAKAKVMAKGHFGTDAVGEAELAEWLKVNSLGTLPLDGLNKEPLIAVVNALQIVISAPRKVVKVTEPTAPMGDHPTDKLGVRTLTRTVARLEKVDTRDGVNVMKMRHRKESKATQQPILNFEEVQEFRKEFPEQCGEVNMWHEWKLEPGLLTCVVQVGRKTRRLLVDQQTFERMRNA